jgi:hypothetical protein
VGNGPKNPILTLAEKHNVKTVFVRIIVIAIGCMDSQNDSRIFPDP